MPKRHSGFLSVGVEIDKSIKNLRKTLRKEGIPIVAIKRASPHPLFDLDLPKGSHRYLVSVPAAYLYGQRAESLSGLRKKKGEIIMPKKRKKKVEEEEKQSRVSRLLGLPLKAMMKLGDWERKQIDKIKANRIQDDALKAELKVIEDAAYKEESKKLAKQRGKKKAHQKGKGTGFFGGVNLKMPNLMEGIDDPFKTDGVDNMLDTTDRNADEWQGKRRREKN